MYKKLVSIFIFLGAACIAHQAQAATDAVVLTVHTPNNNIVITKSLVDSWRTGSYHYTATANFYSQEPVKLSSGYSPTLIYTWLVAQTKNIDVDAVSGDLIIRDNTAVSFTPPIIGVRLDPYQTTKNIIKALKENLSDIDVANQSIEPEHSLSETNDLGINERIGHGESVFKGSPKNRRHNIQTGVDKLTGIIIAPGEEFSFDKNICPVDKTTGYLPELVIKAEGTIPEYGGGLCQVSSTVFRAAMDAGLKITMRKNHSYAVQYYAPQGTDATTYCGGIDFRFLNDTPASILIWPHFEDTDKLVFDFYGTKDGRKVILEKPVQYDRKSDGSMKATWVRVVTKDGITTTDTFKSNYLPPALFHKEEKLDSPGQGTVPTTPATPGNVTSTTSTTPPPPIVTPPPTTKPTH